MFQHGGKKFLLLSGIYSFWKTEEEVAIKLNAFGIRLSGPTEESVDCRAHDKVVALYPSTRLLNGLIETGSNVSLGWAQEAMDISMKWLSVALQMDHGPLEVGVLLENGAQCPLSGQVCHPQTEHKDFERNMESSRRYFMQRTETQKHNILGLSRIENVCLLSWNVGEELCEYMAYGKSPRFKVESPLDKPICNMLGLARTEIMYCIMTFMWNRKPQTLKMMLHSSLVHCTKGKLGYQQMFGRAMRRWKIWNWWWQCFWLEWKSVGILEEKWERWQE